MNYIFFICNIILTISGGVFFLMLYGRSQSIVHRWSFVGHWSLKVGLAAFAAGAMFTALSFETPTIHELLRAFGAALIWTWACFFHYKYFINDGRSSKKLA